MSVFTPVGRAELGSWLEPFGVGKLLAYAGIPTGIENTNFFVTTSHGEFVLTLFETLDAGQLPYYLDLLVHLSARGIPCPCPLAADGSLIHILADKPASLATRLPGVSLETVTPAHCAQIGALLARLHLAAAEYPAQLADPRDAAWRERTAAAVLPRLAAEEAAALRAEVARHAERDGSQLPGGPIHADLFRDNTLFAGANLSGIVDFYSAYNGAWAYDVAVTLNDWCVDDARCIDLPRASALLGAYAAIRPFTSAEQTAWPELLRLAALRFWLSRLYDFHFPRPGEMTYAKDPGHFREVLAGHAARTLQLPT